MGTVSFFYVFTKFSLQLRTRRSHFSSMCLCVCLSGCIEARVTVHRWLTAYVNFHVNLSASKCWSHISIAKNCMFFFASVGSHFLPCWPNFAACCGWKSGSYLEVLCKRLVHLNYECIAKYCLLLIIYEITWCLRRAVLISSKSTCRVSCSGTLFSFF